MAVSTQVLTGQALLDHLQNSTRLSLQQIAIQCGYVAYSKSGQEQANLKSFYDAVLSAKGIQLDP